MSKVNLLANPSFVRDTTFWHASGSGTAITRTTTDAWYGDACLEIFKAAVANAGAYTDRIAITPSLPYTISAYLKIPVGEQNGSFKITLTWYTALSGGSLISTVNTQLIPLTFEDDWYHLGGTFTAPSNANAVVVSIIQPTSGTFNKIFLVDAVLLEQASTINEYFEEVTQDYETSTVNKALSQVPKPHITGMELNADVAIGNLVLNTIDETGTVWVCTDIDGWWGQPDADVPDLPRGWGDGSYDASGKYLARQITLNGVFLPPAKDKVAVARDRLIMNTDLVHKGAWLRTNENPTRASFVRSNGRPMIATINARGRTEFSIGLKAADPVKYEWIDGNPDGFDLVTLIPGETATVVKNKGNTSVTVLMYVTGGVKAAAYIQNTTTDQQMVFANDLATDKVFGIDTYSREADIDGVASGTARNTLDVLVEWITLAPGDNYMKFVNPTYQNSRCAVYFRSGWIG